MTITRVFKPLEEKTREGLIEQNQADAGPRSYAESHAKRSGKGVPDPSGQLS